jgi:hypothetical protein
VASRVPDRQRTQPNPRGRRNREKKGKQNNMQAEQAVRALPPVPQSIEDVDLDALLPAGGVHPSPRRWNDQVPDRDCTPPPPNPFFLYF